MNQELEIKLQAYMDGELSERESRQVEAWVAQDKEATRMLNELAWTRSFLVENEPAPAVPESRDFYWSKTSRPFSQPDDVNA
jgi:anti-sigma factor RsiW